MDVLVDEARPNRSESNASAGPGAAGKPIRKTLYLMCLRAPRLGTDNTPRPSVSAADRVWLDSPGRAGGETLHSWTRGSNDRKTREALKVRGWPNLSCARRPELLHLEQGNLIRDG